MKEIFWGDYKIDEAQAIEMIRHGSEEEKRFLFGKILFNSSNLLKDIRHFQAEDLQRLLANYEIKSAYKKRFAQKRLDILKSLYAGESVPIKGLSWKHRNI